MQGSRFAFGPFVLDSVWERSFGTISPLPLAIAG